MFYNHEPPHQSLATERLGTFMSKSEKNLTEQKEKHLENRAHPSLNLATSACFVSKGCGPLQTEAVRHHLLLLENSLIVACL